jgi:DNA-binding MarR family transcriptional regulator
MEKREIVRLRTIRAIFRASGDWVLWAWAVQEAAGMDAVMFEMKGAHLAAQRVGRRLLRVYGLTPARFDLMNALGHRGLKQSDLWRRLNVVRSVVCEMARALRALGWVTRFRAADGRTWVLELTRRGREVLERAYAWCVGNGDVAQYMDVGLTNGHVDVDALDARNLFVHRCVWFQSQFRVQPRFEGRALYTWDPADYYFCLGDLDDPPSFFAFVREVPSPACP